MSIGFVYHEHYLLHEHTPTHPERRERLMYTIDQLKEEGIFDLPQIDVIKPEAANEKDMRRVHSPQYLEKLKRMSNEGRGSLSMDTHLSKHTWESSLLAAGGIMEAGDLVLQDTYKRTYVMSRPGGHHAFSNHGHGFCFTNNTAVAIRYFQEQYDRINKVLVWDWDAHHCDGTQEIFYEDANVLVVSTHQDGRTLFPGTGFVEETGRGAGEGYQVNVPLPPKTGDEGYFSVVEHIFEPLAYQFEPDLFFIEAGQDNHFTDPITDLGMTAQGYTRLMNKAVSVATDLCDGRFIASQAGGYGIEGGLPYTNTGVFAAMAELDTSNIREPGSYHPPESRPDVTSTINRVKQTQSKYWDFKRD